MRAVLAAGIGLYHNYLVIILRRRQLSAVCRMPTGELSTSTTVFADEV